MSPDPVCSLFLNIGGKFYFYLLFQIIFLSMADPFGDLLTLLKGRVGPPQEVGGALLVGAWLYLALVLGPTLLSAAPYGKFSGSAATPAIVRMFLGWQMSARLGWFLQELPRLYFSN